MKRVAMVVAHPDDESYPFAGTLARLADLGVEVHVVCATRGEGGWDLTGEGRTGAALAEARARELARSCEVLGAAPPCFLDMPDGGVEITPERLHAALAPLEPDVLFTLGHDGAYGHVDHLAVTAMVGAVAGGRPVLHAVFPPGLFEPFRRKMKRFAPAALGLPDDAPLGSRLFDLEVDIRPVQQRKLDSVAAHRTQVQGGDPRRFLFDGLLDAVLDVERFRYATESRIADWPLQPRAG